MKIVTTHDLGSVELRETIADVVNLTEEAINFLAKNMFWRLEGWPDTQRGMV